MNRIEHAMKTRHKEVEALRLRVLHELFEQHGIPKEERAHYGQLDLPVCLAALAPALAALLVATGQEDTVAEQFMDVLQYHARAYKGVALAHRPMFGPVQ